MQGYDKMLSDAFNNLNNQFGQKLAALGTTGNYDVLPISKGGTGRSSVGTALTADLVVSRTDPTLGRALTVGYGGLGCKDNAIYAGDGLNPDDYRTAGELIGEFVIKGFGSFTGYLKTASGHYPGLCSQHFTYAGNGKKINRVFLGEWQPWIVTAEGGANSDITSLSGLTTALSITQGGTGGKTQADARAGLGLGTASTLAAGSAAGSVMLSGDRASPIASTINTWGNSFQIWNNTTTGYPEAGQSGTIINSAWPDGAYGAQILMSFSGKMFFRSGSYSTAVMREVYHTGNTTRAADGTLKAI
ncbi:hypothetical protein [Pseudomonas sp.]|uniref:hypothetical protein n=1 Tax=Pseudomonas sp. TaxID=306 RepID=UPI003C76312B